MKKFMILGLLSLALLSCNQTATKNDNTNITQTAQLADQDAKVKVYYFHGKQRCVTCLTAQQVTEEAIRENFSGNPDVAFLEIDVSEPGNEELAEKYEAVFSTLIIANEKEYKDVTEECFALAKGNPADLKALIVKETNAFLSL
jgi:thioredoxin-related protein